MGRKRIVDETPMVLGYEEEEFGVESVESLIPPRNEVLDALRGVAADINRWGAAKEVLTNVRAVKTCFPQFNKATKVNGFPIERFTLVHGPSAHGKTTFAIGVGMSFLMGNHFYAHCDAENTTPADYVDKLMGSYADHPAFLAMRPRTYEQAIDGVRQFCEVIHKAREEGKIPADTSGVVVMDSIQKLMPQHLLDKIRKEGADGLGGRAGQLKAAMNQAWLNDLIPMLNQTGTAVLAIGREAQDPNATEIDRKFGNDWKLTGGVGLVYDASLLVRVTRSSWVYDKPGENGVVIGEKHKLRVWKSKVEAKDAKHTECFFYTSNGKGGYAEGFDFQRDYLELGVDCGVVTKAGSWFSLEDDRLGQGEHNAVLALHRNPKLFERLKMLVDSTLESEVGAS